MAITDTKFGKGIGIATGFDLGAQKPLDSRYTVATIEERDAHVEGNRAYKGMLVYVEEDNKTYQYIANSWKEFGFNTENFQAQIEDNLESDSAEKALSANQGKILKGMVDNIDEKIVQVDYEENDSESLKYIKNRPFYSKKLLEDTLVPEEGFSKNPAVSISAPNQKIGQTTEEFWNYINNSATPLNFIKEGIESIYWLNSTAEDSSDWYVEEKSLKDFPDAVFSWYDTSAYRTLQLHLTSNRHLGYLTFWPNNTSYKFQISNMRNTKSSDGTTYYQQVYGIKFKEFPIKPIDTKYLPGSLLPEPTTLADNTIPIVSNGIWTTTTLTFAEEAEF